MAEKHGSTLINSDNGSLAFKIFSFQDNSPFDHLQRHNYSTIILITEGEGELKAEVSQYPIRKPSMIFLSPYQPYMIIGKGVIAGVALQFHTDFFCTLKFDKEVSCRGILFDNIYEPPLINLEKNQVEIFLSLIDQMKVELKTTNFAQQQLLVSLLRIFIINASRIRMSHKSKAEETFSNNSEPFILQNLKDAIEKHYRTKRSASEYGPILNISAKSLARICKTHFNKTITDLIAERVIIEAKRELYLTDKPVKSIAHELGFNDEYYFSRFFKTNTDVSPKAFRDSVGFARGE